MRRRRSDEARGKEVRLALRLGLVAACATLAACAGSDPQPLELVSIDPFGGEESLIDGGGGSSIVGYGSSAGSYLPTLRLVRHDAASPDRLEPIGDVSFTGGGRITLLRVSDEAALLIVGGSVLIVDLTVPSLPTETLPLPGAALDLAASGRWVAAAQEDGLVLVHRDAPATTVAHATRSAPTALLPTPTGLLAFTAEGYVRVDVTAAEPTFEEVSDPILRGFTAAEASADGARAVVSGPGSTFDRTRVLSLDLSIPGAPLVIHSRELSGIGVAFAWDGGGDSVVAIHGAGDDATSTSFHQGYLLREGPDGFEDSGLPLPFWSQSGQPLAAHAGRLFAAQAGGVALLRIR